MMRRKFTIIAVAACLASSASAELTEQEKAEIASGMQTMELFRGLPLSGDPGDIARHWTMLKQVRGIPVWNSSEQDALTQRLSDACFYDLKVMNQTLTAPNLQAQFQDPEVRQGFAARYYHLLYFIFQYYRTMGWGWDVINADFATTGWSDCAEYRWRDNAAKLRPWLGATAAVQQSVAVQQAPAVAAASTAAALPAGGRSVREIEAAIRRQQSYIRELERKHRNASEEYSRYKDTNNRLYANYRTLLDPSAKVTNSMLATVQQLEGFIRKNEKTLEDLYAELDEARARESKAAAAGESQSAAAPSAAGAAVPAAKRFCTECGAKASPGDKFCASCGHKL